MKNTDFLCFAGAVIMLLAPPADAQYVQNALAVPIAPGCVAGESWTKNGVRYQCETPPPSCQYGFASGPSWTGSSWSYSCNSPPVVTPPPSQTTPTPGSELAACGAAIRSALSGQPWQGRVLQLENTQYGLGWVAEEALYQWGGGGSYVGTDGYFQLWQGGGGGGLDLVTTGIDDTSAGDLNYGNCYINASTGAISRIVFSVVTTRCPGCGGSSGQ